MSNEHVHPHFSSILRAVAPAMSAPRFRDFYKSHTERVALTLDSVAAYLSKQAFLEGVSHEGRAELFAWELTLRAHAAQLHVAPPAEPSAPKTCPHCGSDECKDSNKDGCSNSAAWHLGGTEEGF